MAAAGTANGRDEGRNETELEHLDRNLMELTAEPRVAGTGVQVLFAFLLMVPFSDRFHAASQFTHVVYFAVLLLAAATIGLFIGPSAHHRLLFREEEKTHLVFAGNRMVAGLGCLALSLVGILLLITSMLFGTLAAIVATTAGALFFGITWFALPLRRRGSANSQGSHPRVRGSIGLR